MRKDAAPEQGKLFKRRKAQGMCPAMAMNLAKSKYYETGLVRRMPLLLHLTLDYTPKTVGIGAISHETETVAKAKPDRAGVSESNLTRMNTRTPWRPWYQNFIQDST